MTREERKKKNKRLGWILTGSAHVIVIALLFAFKISLPEPQPEPALVLDFTSSSSSQGGSSADESTPEDSDPGENNPTDPVITQDKKSPVKSSEKKKGGDTKGSTKKDPKIKGSAKNAFNKGNGPGNEDGDGEGDIPGSGGKEKGGKGYGKIGAGDGNHPDFINPTQRAGKVVVKLFVNRAGKVTSVQVLSTHKQTTTSDAVLLNKAKKDGEKFEFSANGKREETSIAYKVINYTLR